MLKQSIRKTGIETEADLQKHVHGLLKGIKKNKEEFIWRWDMAGENMTDVNERSKLHQMNKNSRGFPDLTIWFNNRTLFLELKRQGVNVALDIRANDAHTVEQFEMLRRFKKQGHSAAFAVGFESAKQKIYNFIDNREISIF